MITSILNILDDIAADPSRLKKEAILKNNARNDLLKRVFWAAYNPDITYWIQTTPAFVFHSDDTCLDTAISIMLDRIASRACTGNAAIDLYRSVLCSLSADDAEVLRRIVSRDLRCGVGIPTINKIWKGLIPTYELMKAESDPKNLKYPCYVQNKFDGIRCLVTRTLDDEIIMRTSGGNRITSLDVMVPFFNQVIQLGETWDGELVCYQEGSALPRKTSNGILNKAIRGTISKAEASLVTFRCWDIIDLSQTLEYRARLDTMYLRFTFNTNLKVIPVDTKVARCFNDIELLFAAALENGEEGIIAKNTRAVWQPKRTFDLVKFKAEKTVDLVVVEWNEGTNSNVGKTGALVCETSDGKIRVNVGAGFSAQQRVEFAKDKPIDRIIEVCYNSRISKKDGGVDSLYLPRFVKMRHDKTVANSSEGVV